MEELEIGIHCLFSSNMVLNLFNLIHFHLLEPKNNH
jgi:hypothetical protein